MRLQYHIEAILSNVETMEKRGGTAGTQLIDSTWRWLGDNIPDQLKAPRTDESLQMWTQHIRFAQWMRMVGNSGTWEAFCEAAVHYEDTLPHEKVRLLIAFFNPNKKSTIGLYKAFTMILPGGEDFTSFEETKSSS